MIRPWRHLALSALACLVLADCSAAEHKGLAGFSFAQPDEVIMLGPSLREVSGLALSASGNLVAHNDERGVVYELDLNTRTSVVNGLLSGGRHVKGDFEGVATHGDDTWLVTSNGYISHFRRSDAETVSVYDTGLKSVCEIEGLVYDPITSHLLLACKETYTEDMKGKVALFRWSLERREREPEPVIIERSEIRRVLGAKKVSSLGDCPLTRRRAIPDFVITAQSDCRDFQNRRGSFRDTPFQSTPYTARGHCLS